MFTERKKIMLVDDNITNLAVGKNILAATYDTFTVPSGEKLFVILQRVIPDLILLDIEMPDMNGYDVIRRLKDHPETRHIPVVFLTAKNDPGSELEGLSLGAIDYITKPFSPPLLLKRIELHLLVESQKRELQHYNSNLQQMVNEQTAAILELQNAVLNTVAGLVEWRDDITGGHIARTQGYLRALVGALELQGVYTDIIEGWNIDSLVSSAQLHDVGKIVVSDSILMKPGKLTVDEFEEMKKHTSMGGRIIEDIERNTRERTFLGHAKVFAVAHHERWDGTGYPQGLSGDEIPLQGRLMAIADVYDALISERPYKPAYSHEQAVQTILEGRGTHFDPRLVDVFTSVKDDFYSYACL